MFENGLPLEENVLRLNTYAREPTLTKQHSLAINSMYKWYENSAVCYVYLSDVEISPKEMGEANSLREQDWLEQQVELRRRFRSSCWFTRGWTLQELLAPDLLTFFDANWKMIGSRGELAQEICLSTKIDTKYLMKYNGSTPISSASIAKKMSFASRRVTSREEDMAYCLLGLFDINMPLLYGEGAIKSFRRLQIEIMRNSIDDSLFAWTSDLPASGMLAPQPSYFAHSDDVEWTNDRRRFFKPPWSFSSRGLEFPIPDRLPMRGLVPIYLNCFREVTGVICIQLRLRGKRAVRTRCSIMDEAGYPQFYKRIMYDLDNGHVLTRMVYIEQPNEEEIEYESLLASIEEGRLNLTDIESNARPDAPLLNPGPFSITAASNGRLISPGDASQVDEERASQRTHNALRIAAMRNVNFKRRKDTEELFSKWLSKAWKLGSEQ